MFDHPDMSPKTEATGSLESKALVYRHSLSELKLMLIVWLVFAAWCLGYCLTHAYQEIDGPVATTMGFPSWVFWGIFLPWMACTLTTIGFAGLGIADDALEPDKDSN